MKKNLILSLLLLLPAFMMQSCLHNQEDKVDEVSSQRLKEYLQKAKNVLTSAEHGWLFEIFPKNTQEYGGYAFICKFDEMTATITAEPLPGTGAPSGTDECYYKLGTENGPVLIFDTYSPIMHYFAEGTGSGYQAYGGDTEYVIDEITDDVIKVHGARSKNKYYLYRLTVPADEYLAARSEFESAYLDPADAYYTCITGTINGEAFEGEFLTSRQMEYTVGDATGLSTKAFVYTDEGIRLYSAITIGGVKIREFKYNFDDHSYTAIDEDGKEYPLEGSFPQWVINYDEWAGSYEFYISSTTDTKVISTMDVELVPVADRSVYLMKGVNPNYDLTLNYNKAENFLELQPQLIGEPLANGHVVLLAGRSPVQPNGSRYVHYGLYTTTIASGMKTYWNEEEQMFKWIDNGKWGSYKIDSYIIYVFNGKTRVGQISLSGEQGAYAINGAALIYAMHGLKRK